MDSQRRPIDRGSVNVDEIKENVSEQEGLTVPFRCDGVPYLVRMQNGDVKGQSAIYDALEAMQQSHKAVDGSESMVLKSDRDVANERYEFIHAVLCQDKEIDEEEIRLLSTDSNEALIMDLWRYGKRLQSKS